MLTRQQSRIGRRPLAILSALVAALSLTHIPTQTNALDTQQLELFPANEYCLFVPPPAWPELVRLPPDEHKQLAYDRVVVQAARYHLQLNGAPMVSLAPDSGLSRRDLKIGGAPLVRALNWTFAAYLDAWRALRNGRAEGVDLASLDVLQEACSRRVIMVLSHDVPTDETHIQVFSLITGRRLASAP